MNILNHYKKLLDKLNEDLEAETLSITDVIKVVRKPELIGYCPIVAYFPMDEEIEANYELRTVAETVKEIEKYIKDIESGEGVKASIDMFPFVVEALGNCPKIYKDINRLYQGRKYEFYQVAKSHELYNHQIVTEGSILQEEYCRKILGILLVAETDDEIKAQLQKLIEKGFNWTYNYVNNHDNIKIGDFIAGFSRKFKQPVDNNGTPIDYHFNILIMLSLGNRTIIRDDDYNSLMRMLKLRMEHYNDTTPTRININKISDIDKERIKSLKEAIYKKYDKIRNFDDIVDGRFDAKGMEQCSFLFDYERLSSLSIFQDIRFTDKDIDGILYLYIVGKKDEKDIKAAAEFLISNIYILYLIKAYKQVKDMYFANNKETMFVEMDSLEKRLKVAEAENIALTNTLKEGLSEQEKIHTDLIKENERLKAELESEKRSRQELNAMRDFIFALDEQKEYSDTNINVEELKSFKAILIGGHEKWQQKMKESLPEFVFIRADNTKFDIRLLDGIKIVFVYTNYLNHAVYYRLMSAIEGTDVKVVYLQNQNEELVLREIYRVYKNVYR